MSSTFCKMYRLLFVVTIFAKGAFAAMCLSNVLTDADRTTITNRHNALRSALAQGKAQTKAGYAPAGRNIYKLQWDCALEAAAQAAANTCKYEQGVRSNVGENLMLTSTIASTSALLNNAVNSWWSELAEFNIPSSDTNNILTSAVLYEKYYGHFTQMAWGMTKTIGCGIAQCGSATRPNLVVCHYSPAGNYVSEPIYQLGPACRLNSECTTYPGSTCSISEGLCLDPGYRTVPVNDPSNRCADSEIEQPSKAFCLGAACAAGYICKYSASAMNYVCCAPKANDPAPTDCSYAEVYMQTVSTGASLPLYCPVLGTTGQCPAAYPFCVYSLNRQQNVCCRRNIGK